jgi:hypothetical protein
MRLAALEGASIHRCLAFEASVLRRLRFTSVAIPFSGDPNLAWYLKLWHKRVLANDLAHGPWWALRALIENGTGRLEDDDLERITAAAYEPGHRLSNPALAAWLPETEAWWFDNVRARLETIESVPRRALAIRAALLTADYALSFPQEAAHLKRSLSRVFADLARAERPPVDNGSQSMALNLDAESFLGRTRADLLYVCFPGPEGFGAWRRYRRGFYEVWLRGRDDFWGDLENAQRNRFGGAFHSKQAYLVAVERFIRSAGSFGTIALLLRETGWLSLGEMTDLVTGFRKIRVTYTKDLTQVARGQRLNLIVAQ